MFSLKFNLSFVFVIVVFCYLNISFFLWVSLCSLHVVNTWVRIFWMCWPPLPMTAPAICKWKKILSYAARREGGDLKGGLTGERYLHCSVSVCERSPRCVCCASGPVVHRFHCFRASFSLSASQLPSVCVFLCACVCVSVFLSAKEKHKSKHA